MYHCPACNGSVWDVGTSPIAPLLPPPPNSLMTAARVSEVCVTYFSWVEHHASHAGMPVGASPPGFQCEPAGAGDDPCAAPPHHPRLHDPGPTPGRNPPLLPVGLPVAGQHPSQPDWDVPIPRYSPCTKQCLHVTSHLLVKAWRGHHQQNRSTADGSCRRRMAGAHQRHAWCWQSFLY